MSARAAAGWLAGLAACQGPAVPQRTPPPPAPAAPAAPQLVAIPTADHGLTIVAPGSAAPLVLTAVGDLGGDLELGWLDDHVLVAWPRGTHRVARFLDGVRVPDLVVPDAPDPAHLVIGAWEEIWLEGATNLRVWPEPPRASAEPPPSRAELRSPTVPAPPGYALALIPVRGVTGVRCAHGGSTTITPAADQPAAASIDELRWVLTSPPIYAARAGRTTDYHLGCDPDPLEGFALLGNDRWAIEQEGSWTFHAGPRTLGSIPGIPGLVANRLAP